MFQAETYNVIQSKIPLSATGNSMAPDGANENRNQKFSSCF
jgi:hypothetical protein